MKAGLHFVIGPNYENLNGLHKNRFGSDWLTIEFFKPVLLVIN